MLKVQRVVKMHFDMKKPRTEDAEVVNCPRWQEERMDPVGYFLIRTADGKLEAGICDYNKINIVKKVWMGGLPQDVYQHIISDNPTIMRDHCAYLAKELTRAWICMKLGIKYVQDGKIDGSFPEVEWISRKESAPAP